MKTDWGGQCIALSPPPSPPRLGPLHPCEGLVLPSGAQLGSPPALQCLQDPRILAPPTVLGSENLAGHRVPGMGLSEWGDRRKCGVLPGLYLQTQVTV